MDVDSSDEHGEGNGQRRRWAFPTRICTDNNEEMRASGGHLGDVIAGLSVAVVLIPQSMAYADLAGMPAVAGLYASALPPLVAAVFASSPYLQTGPVAVTALLTYGALSSAAPPGSPQYASLGLALALIVGLARVLIGLFRGGWIAYLMSAPMLLGFVPAAAILIATSQLPKALGVDAGAHSDNQVVQAGWALGHLGRWEWAAVTSAVIAFAVIVLGRRLHPLFPGILLCAVVGTAIGATGGYSGAMLDEVPAGLPPFTLDDLPWAQVPGLALSGVLIALIGFTEAASISRRFATEDRTTWDADREFVSQGAANLAAAVSGGFPCGGSFSRSSVARLSGARTRLSGAVTGLAVLVFLPFAAIAEPMPLAVLGAIVVSAAVGLMRFGPLIAIWRLSLAQAVVAWTTFVATLALAPRLDWAVLIGVGLSIAIFLWRMLSLEIDVEVRAAGEGEVLVLTPRGVLWFGTAQRLDATLLEALAAHPQTTHLQVDLRGLGRIDTTGALVLATVLEQARAAGLEASLDGIPRQSRELTQRILNSGRALG